MDKDKDMAKAIRKAMVEYVGEKYYELCVAGFSADIISKALYNANYRKVAEDEIVIKKSKIGMLEKTIDYLEMEKAQLNKQLEQAKKETAREILQIIDGKLDLYRNGVIGGTPYDAGYKSAINEIKFAVKNKYDIELR